MKECICIAEGVEIPNVNGSNFNTENVTVMWCSKVNIKCVYKQNKFPKQLVKYMTTVKETFDISFQSIWLRLR